MFPALYLLMSFDILLLRNFLIAPAANVNKYNKLV